MERWLRTNEAVETVTSLQMVCEQLPKVVDDLHRWKWVIISLHNALQCMVQASRGSDRLDVTTDKGKRKWLAPFKSNSGCFPKLYMDNFLHLYEKTQVPQLMKRYAQSQTFKPKGTQTESVERLNELRNKFIHFFPKSLSLEVSGLPAIVQDCIHIIDFLAFECGNVLWEDDGLETMAKELILGIRLHLKVLSAGYDE